MRILWVVNGLCLVLMPAMCLRKENRNVELMKQTHQGHLLLQVHDCLCKMYNRNKPAFIHVCVYAIFVYVYVYMPVFLHILCIHFCISLYIDTECCDQ